jgi:hypothetical protein
LGFASLLNYGNVQLRPALSLTVSSRQVVIFAAAAGAFAVAVVFLAIFVQQSSRISSEDILADARSLDEVQHFLKRYPGSFERVGIGTGGALANIVFVSTEESEFETCSDEFCVVRLTVRPYIRVIADTTERGTYYVYCGLGTYTIEGNVESVREFRPFDEKNSLC